MNFVMKVSQTLFLFLQFPSTEIYTQEYAAGSSNQKGFKVEIWDWFYCLSGELMTMIIFLGFRDRNLETHGSWQQNILSPVVICTKGSWEARFQDHYPRTVYKTGVQGL